MYFGARHVHSQCSFLFVEQELFTLPEHLSSTQGFSAVRVIRSLALCMMFCRSFDYPLGVLTLFLYEALSSET